jgi:DNA excision repair protein ERCC-4
MQMMENAEDDDDSHDDGNDTMDMSDDDGEGDTTADANTRTVHPPASSGNKQHATNNSGTNTTLETQSYASRIEMLRAKLHAKMTEKRALAAGMSVEEYDANNSKVVDGSSATSSTTTTTTPPALVSKRAARRAEKRKRQEAAKQRNKKNGYSTVIQGNIQQQQQQQQQHRMGGNNSTSFTKSNSPTTTIITASQDLATIDYQSLAGLKPKLDGALNNKSLIGVTGGGGSGSSGLNKKKSLEKLLADAERKQARLRELKASGNEEDKEKARNIEWGETLKVAG